MERYVEDLVELCALLDLVGIPSPSLELQSGGSGLSTDWHTEVCFRGVRPSRAPVPVLEIVAEFSSAVPPECCGCLDPLLRRLCLYGTLAAAHLLSVAPECPEERVVELGLTLEHQAKLSEQLAHLAPGLVGHLGALLAARYSVGVASFPAAVDLDGLLASMLARLEVDPKPYVVLDGDRVAAQSPSAVVARAGGPSELMRYCLMAWAGDARAAAGPADRRAAVEAQVILLREDGFHFTRDDVARVWAAVAALEGTSSSRRVLVAGIQNMVNRSSARTQGLYRLMASRWMVFSDGLHHVLAVPEHAVPALVVRGRCVTLGPVPSVPLLEVSAAAEVFLALWNGRDPSVDVTWEAAQACLA